MLARISIATLTVAALFGLVALAGSRPGAARAGGDRCHQAPAYQGDGTDVKMFSNCFSPSILRVEPGATVAFHNHDNVVHVISGIPNKAPGEARLNGGDDYAATFVQPGIYPYFCNLHLGMVGAVVVGEYETGGAATTASSAPAVAAVQSGEDAREQPPASAASLSDEGDGGVPLALGLALAALGLVSAGTVTFRRWLA